MWKLFLVCLGSVGTPPAGQNPPFAAAVPVRGSITNLSATRAAPTLTSAPPSGPTDLAVRTAVGILGPNISSTLIPSARAIASAAQSDGSDLHDSTADTACREDAGHPGQLLRREMSGLSGTTQAHPVLAATLALPDTTPA
jgi:hypothetical protein